MKIKPTDAARLIKAHGLHVAGAPLAEADKVVILIHGRHASGEVILPLADRLAQPGLCFLAPDAETGSWYPGAFMAPIISNEPYLSRALDRVGAILAAVAELGFGIGDQIFLAGFSQGACLASEFAARNARRYAGVLGFSGGLIGPEPMVRQDQGSLAGTPIFLGCREKDPFIPARRVTETAAHFETLGAKVTWRLYPGSDHIINDDEIAHARGILAPAAVA
ncbi:alpha/beta hydrolase [Taklimakanibacter lacteus]|uniref:alpha/beta hydrolase n=1 Tax=Taklimakanibacter lacteus TaxID=2268456 RepID=UPI000E667ABD